MEKLTEFSRKLDVGSLGETAKHIHLDANGAECTALARRFDLVSVDSLVADVIVERIEGGDLVRVRGRVSAQITQSCVFTGKVVVADIAESVDEKFGPPGKATDEVEFTLEDEDPPEPIVDGSIDLGEIVSQYLGVAIDPYPRAAGAEIPQRYQAEEEEKRDIRKNPFEALGALKRNGE